MCRCQKNKFFLPLAHAFSKSEGYVNVTPTGKAGRYNYNYIYQYKDHLGNVRLDYTQDELVPGEPTLVVLEENHYYPFGMKHKGYNTSQYGFVEVENGNDYYVNIAQLPPDTASLYKYKYNGKEYQDELGLNMYDYGARNYDPALGRWMNIDPLAEKSRRFSPYTYAVNNPVYFIDPDGMEAKDWYRNNRTGNVIYREGSGNLKGHYNMGRSTNLVSGTGQNLQLNANGTFKDLNSGKVYGNNQSVVFNSSSGSTITSKQNWAQRNLVIEGSISGSVGLQLGGKVGAVEGSAGVLKQEIGQVGYDFINNRNISSFAESKTENFVEGSIGLKGTPLSAGGGANYSYSSTDGLNGMDKGTLATSGQVGLDSGTNLLPSQPALNVSPNAKVTTDCYCIDFGAGIRAIFGVNVDLKIGIKK